MRPMKEGLDYFPLDVDMDTDDKIVLIESRYGAEGFTVVIKLLMKIYKNGYYYKWTEREILLFSKRVDLNEKLVSDVVKDCINWKLFDEKKFKKYKILTSKGIQKRYFEAVKRRLKINVYKEYALIPVNEYINKDNVNIYSINDDSSTQSKVKKSKVKKAYADNVNMFEEEYKKLLEKYGETDTKAMITILDNYKGANPRKRKYDSDYKAILSWVVDRLFEDKNKHQEEGIRYKKYEG